VLAVSQDVGRGAHTLVRACPSLTKKGGARSASHLPPVRLLPHAPAAFLSLSLPPSLNLTLQAGRFYNTPEGAIIGFQGGGQGSETGLLGGHLGRRGCRLGRRGRCLTEKRLGRPVHALTCRQARPGQASDAHQQEAGQGTHEGWRRKQGGIQMVVFVTPPWSAPPFSFLPQQRA